MLNAFPGHQAPYVKILLICLPMFLILDRYCLVARKNLQSAMGSGGQYPIELKTKVHV